MLPCTRHPTIDETTDHSSRAFFTSGAPVITSDYPEVGHLAKFHRNQRLGKVYNAIKYMGQSHASTITVLNRRSVSS